MKRFYLFFAIIFSANPLCAADIERLKETNNPLCKSISDGCTKGLEKATVALSKMPFFNR